MLNPSSFKLKQEYKHVKSDEEFETDEESMKISEMNIAGYRTKAECHYYRWW